MKKSLYKKGLVLGIILLFIGASVIPSTIGTIEKKITLPGFNTLGKVLYVGGSGPNNYTKIQDAIDDASDGDTVFVYDDSSPYYEHIVIDKSISIGGEGKDTTVIDGGGGDEIQVYADWVNITDFTIRDSQLNLDYSNYVSINDNIFTYKWGCGLRIESCNFINIIGNHIYNKHSGGIYIKNSDHILVTDNIIEFNGHTHNVNGIYLYNSNNNNITNNIITNNRGEGIFLSDSDNNVIEHNIISLNSRGIELEVSYNNTIVDNTITSNTYGITVGYSCSYNIIHGNNICFNKINGISFFGYTSYNIITDNKISNSEDGIYISWANPSNNNNIEGNTISNNIFHGMLISGTNHFILNNTVVKNMITGIVIRSYNSTIEGNCIFQNREGMGIVNNSNIIKNNIISYNNLSGTYFKGANNNTFQDNDIISNSGTGLYIHSNSLDNTIIGNNIISNKEDGISLKESDNNRIISNNFFNNKRNAYFLDCKNIWNQNYWNRPRILPKLIFGRIEENLWFNIDWRPALKPYDIEV